MKLKSFGCSFIYGTELADATCIPGATIPSNTSYAAHLAKHLKCQYECYARPGAGNLQIAERVLSQAVNSEPTLFLIGCGLSKKVLQSVGIKPLIQGVALWLIISLASLWVIMNVNM